MGKERSVGYATAKAAGEFITVASFSFTSNNGGVPDGIEDPFDIVGTPSHPGDGRELFPLKGKFTYVHAMVTAHGAVAWHPQVVTVQGTAAENSVEIQTLNTSHAAANSNDVRFTVTLTLTT